jgi:hypothetical protein
MKVRIRSAVILSLAIAVLLVTSNRLQADTGMCGGAMTTLPFTDVRGNIFFLPDRPGVFLRPDGRDNANDIQSQ